MSVTDQPTILASRNAELRIGIVCINLDPGSREALERMVAQSPGTRVVESADRMVTPREVTRILEQFQHRVCVVDFDEGEESIKVARNIRAACDTGVALFAASSDASPEQIITAMRAGCSEYLTKPFRSDQILAALSQLTSLGPGKLPLQKGRILTLMGAKGGVGVTSLAVHVALNLVERHGKRCLLIDQHPALGEAALCLGLGRHQYSFYELVHNMDRLDTELLQGFLLHHSSGLDVLDAPQAMQAFRATPPEAIEQTLSFLADNYHFVLVDSPPGLSEDSCAAIRQSDRLSIVVTPELPAVHNAIRSIEFLTGLHYPSENIDIIMNRCSKRNRLDDREIESSLRRSIAVKVPNNYALVVGAINAGMPIDRHQKSDLLSVFDSWTDQLVGDEPEPMPSKNGSSRGKFLGLFGN